MSDQLNFTLEFSHDYANGKTRLNLDFVPPHSPDLHGRTKIPHFDPKKLRHALHFVSDKVVRRIAEHLRKSDLKSQRQEDWNEREKHLRAWKEAHAKVDEHKTSLAAGAKGEEDYLKKLLAEVASCAARMDVPDEKIKADVEKLIENWTTPKHDEERLTGIFFEEMSAGVASYAVLRIANTDVPPPRWP